MNEIFAGIFKIYWFLYSSKFHLTPHYFMNILLVV